jgi:hypothetical protein
MAGKLSVRDAVGSALRFVREQWRVVLFVAGAAAFVQTLALLAFGAGFVWLVVLAAVSATAFAVLTRVALFGQKDVAAKVAGDAVRVAVVAGAIGSIVAILSITLLYVAMSVLIGPYADQVRAAGQNQAALTAIMQHASDSQPGVLLWTLGAWVVISFFLTSHFFLAVPDSVASRRIMIFRGWRWTSSHLLRVAGARILLLLPALVLTGAIQSIGGMALGFTTGDLNALSSQARGNPALFAAFYGFSLFVQLALYSALEAGLSVALYRALKPGEVSVPRAKGSTDSPAPG